MSEKPIAPENADDKPDADTAVRGPNDEANAALIVTAVNAHDALVAALRGLLSQFEAYRAGWLGDDIWRERVGLPNAIQQSHAALALAESTEQGEELRDRL